MYILFSDTTRQRRTRQMFCRTDNVMVLLRLWSSLLFLLTTVGAKGSTSSGTETDIMHAIAGNQFMIRTWPMIGSTLFITVTKDNSTILDMSMGVGVDKNLTAQNSRMMLVYNQTKQEVYLLFENISKEDRGIYEMKEGFNRTNTISNETEADTYDRKDGTWYLEIYVLEPGEIKKGYVGGNISMEFEKSTKQSTLYNYDEPGALLAGSSCSVLTDSSLYGRLRCANDDSGSMYKITIVNVSQRDAGLYKMATGRNETGRCFFSIEESPTCAVVGENMTIGWLYNQQGGKRTLRLIHPNQGVIMLVNQTNFPEIKSNFQHRLLYSGDTLHSFMSFTLLNVRQSDAGLYTIETLHGNTIPASKQLNVEGTCSTRGVIQTTLDEVTAKISVTKQEVVTDQPIKMQCLPISVVIPVVIVAVVVSIATIAMTGCLILIQRRNTLKAEQRRVLEQCETASIVTPTTIRRAPYLPPSKYTSTYGQVQERKAFSHAVLSRPSQPFQLSQPSVYYITNHNHTIGRTDEKTLLSCDGAAYEGVFDSCAPTCTFGSAAGCEKDIYKCILNGNCLSQVSQSTQSLYTQITKGPNVAFRNNTTLDKCAAMGGHDSPLCSAEYKMVDISTFFDQEQTLQDDSVDGESAKSQIPLCNG